LSRHLDCPLLSEIDDLLKIRNIADLAYQLAEVRSELAGLTDDDFWLKAMVGDRSCLSIAQNRRKTVLSCPDFQGV
jgi:hypothetical protein